MRLTFPGFPNPFPEMSRKIGFYPCPPLLLSGLPYSGQREKPNTQKGFRQIRIKLLISFRKLLIKLFAKNILAVIRFSNFVEVSY